MRGVIGETQRLPMVPVSGPGREGLEDLAKDTK
jgi:hypothetical protein